MNGLKLKLYPYLILAYLVLNTNQLLIAQGPKHFGRISIGIEAGTWIPNKLSNRTTMSSLKVPGAKPFLGVFLLSPALKDWTLRGGIGYWNRRSPKNDTGVESVTIIHFMLDLKQIIIPQSRLTPFVCYGLTFYTGSENETSFMRALFYKKKEAGYGINVGAGFDFLITKHWIIGLEFCYHYVKFNHVVGMTDDYSGPKIAANLYYSF